MPDLALDLRHLRYAQLVAEHGSFRRAADYLGVNQSTLSRRIQSLEHRLGITIFERCKTGVHLTPIGRSFMADASIGAEQLNMAVKALAPIRRGQQGHLRIGVMGSLAQGPLGDLLSIYRRSYPHVNLMIEEITLDAALAGVMSAWIDMGFVTGEPQRSDCEIQYLWDETLFVALPADHRLSQRDHVVWPELAAERFLATSDWSGEKTAEIIREGLGTLGLEPDLSIQAVARDNLLNLVGKGFGVTVTHNAAVGSTYPGVAFVPVEPTDTLRWNAVWSGTNRNPALKRLKHLLPMS